MLPIKPQDQLLAKLVENKRFWSFDISENASVSDDVLIEKTLIYLDVEDVNMLFSIYPYLKIKKVWLERVAIQGVYYARLNNFLAWMYFNIKNPEKYLKTIEDKHLKKYE